MHFKYKGTKRLNKKDGQRYTMPTLVKRKLEWLYYIKVDFRVKNIIRDKEAQFIIKGAN